MFKNKRGDIAILLSLGVSLIIFGYISILQLINLNKVRINLKNMTALDGFLSSEMYAWHGFLTKKRQDTGYVVPIDSKQPKYFVNGANVCGKTFGSGVCLAAKEPNGISGGSWEQVNATGAPAALIGGFQSVWTGAKLIVWNGLANVGGIFDPATNKWKAISPAPLQHISRGGAVWAGDRMFVYGSLYSGTYDPTNPASLSEFFNHPTGCFGYFYSPEKDQWVAQNLRIPGQYYEDILCRYGYPPNWTGSKILITTYETSWGVTTGIVWAFDPRNNTVVQVTTVPSDIPFIAPISSGKKLVYYGYSQKKGYTYDSDSNNWSPISPSNAPGCGSGYPLSPVSAGSKVIYSCGTDGGIYDAVSNSWEKMSAVNAPTFRNGMLSVWTGTKLIVWGGQSDCINNNTCGSGGIYDSVKRTWTATKNEGAPKAYNHAAAAWVGDRALVWGGTYTYIDQAKGIVYQDVGSSDTYYYYPNGK